MPSGTQQNRPGGKTRRVTGQNQGHIDDDEATHIHAAFKVIWTPEFLLICFIVSKIWLLKHKPLLCSGKWSKRKHFSLQRVCQTQNCPSSYILNYVPIGFACLCRSQCQFWLQKLHSSKCKINVAFGKHKHEFCTLLQSARMHWRVQK